MGIQRKAWIVPKMSRLQKIVLGNYLALQTEARPFFIPNEDGGGHHPKIRIRHLHNTFTLDRVYEKWMMKDTEIRGWSLDLKDIRRSLHT